jgi:hypothetical protein
VGVRRSTAVAVLVALGMSLGSSRAPAFGPFPAYVDDNGVWTLLSNAQWSTGIGAHAKALRPQGVLELEVPASARRWFRYGENRLDVRVTKGVSKTSASACNRSSSTTLGVAFGLEGYSQADLSVSAGNGDQYVRGSSHGFNGVFTVHNAGPSAAIGGAFSFLAQIGPLQDAFDTLLHAIKATPPFGPCTATEGVAVGRLAVSCRFTLFPPGATATVSSRSSPARPTAAPGTRSRGTTA